MLAQHQFCRDILQMLGDTTKLVPMMLAEVCRKLEYWLRQDLQPD